MPSYQDFLDAANRHGVYNQFSSYDLDLARRDPSAGLSLVTLKKNYANATTDAQRALYNEQANQIRKNFGNYTGGITGGDFIAMKPAPGGFQYDVEAPTWESPYADRIEDLLNQAENFGDFSYDVDSDPLYHNYRKQYLREGERATADTLGKMAAMNGGQVSTSASAAASQAGDYYASQLTDKIPELRNQAYNEWASDYQKILSQLSALQGQEERAYNQYLNEYGQWAAGRDNAYQQYMDQIDSIRYDDETAFERGQIDWEKQQSVRDEARAQVDAILQAGGSPSDNLLKAAGYDPSYINALQQYYRQQAAQKAYKSSDGGSDRSDKGPVADMDYDGLFKAAMESGYPEIYINNKYKEFGFSSKTGLYDAFEAWAENGGLYGDNQTVSPPKKKSYSPDNLLSGIESIWNVDKGSGGKKPSSPKPVVQNGYDISSILALGYGPISEEVLWELVRQGKVEEYKENGVIKFRRK